MNEESVAWLEEALGLLRPQFDGPVWSPQVQRSLVQHLPTTMAIFRLWGWQDPVGATGAAAGLRMAPLRAACRGAAVEFAPWPPVAVRPVLRRALRDAVDPTWRQVLPPVVLSDLYDVLALSWARPWPEGLPEAYAALHQPLVGGDGRLWCHEVLRRATGRKPWPGRELLPPGNVDDWQWAEQPPRSLGLRARARLALAVHELCLDPPTSPAFDLPALGDGP